MKPQYISREQAAAALGISVEDVKRRIKTGDFRTVLKQLGRGRPVPHVLQDDVEFCLQHAKKTAQNAPSPAFADRYTPDDAARVFAELKKETTPQDIVINLKIHPRAIMAILEDWNRIRGALTLSSEQLTEVQKLGLDGVFPLEDSEALMGVIRDAARERQCGSCEKRPATLCRPCMAKAMSPQKREAPPPEPEDEASTEGIEASANGTTGH